MVIRDLGQLSGTVLLYGGPYSNLAATKALLVLADEQCIPLSNRVCTGDVIAYGADAEATWALVAKAGGTVVAGNCERQLAARAEGCGCGFEEGTTCDLLSKGWYDHAQRSLSGDALTEMAQVPDMAVFTHTGRRIAVIHGGVRNISRFLWPSGSDDEFNDEINYIEQEVGEIDVVVAGHCGLAFQRQIGSVTWLNAGVVGLPPHDGRPETRYATLDATGRIVIHRLVYDPAPTVKAMEHARLVQGYHRALETGIWPSEDVLPLPLRRAV
ncbi:MAG: metallophosphoesterase family protein [Pseudomonadota bacterium]